MAQEWFDYVTRLWKEDSAFDWDGTFFKGKGVYGQPHPVQARVPIINAAASEEGRAFAMRNADFLFTPVFDFGQAQETVEDVKSKALSVGREVEVLTFCTVVCRPLRKRPRITSTGTRTRTPTGMR